jgi:ribokinase
MPKIVVVGSANMDLVVRATRAPERGETLHGTEFGTFPGGKGANQAVAAARQGARVTMIGCMGDDPFGAQMLGALRQDGIDTRHVRVDAQAPTGVALITVEAGGDNRIIIVAGANGQVTPAQIEVAAADFAGGDLLLMQLEVPLPAVRRAAELARARGMRVILNAAPAQPLDGDLLALVDYLVINEIEAATLTGLAPTQAEAAAQALRAAGARQVVVTLGATGAILCGTAGCLPVPGFPVAVVDTTAAGDAFVGAFAMALTEDMPLPAAVRRGNAAGALAVTRRGAQPALPTRAETMALLGTHGQDMLP